MTEQNMDSGSLEDLVPTWLAAFPGNTAEAYKRDFRQFAAWHGGPLAAVDRGRAQAWINHLGQLEYSDPTIRRKRSAASSFYTYALAESAVPSNPFQLVRTPKGGTVEKLGLSMDETERLLNTARTSGPTPYALIALLVTTGARISGPCQAQISDMATDQDHQVLRIKLKGGRDKRIPLAPRVHEAILETIGPRTEGPIFTNSYGNPLKRDTAGRWITRIGKKAGVGHITPHTLRHTCAGLLAAAGTDPTRIKDLLGHRSIQTTMGYIHLVETLDDSPAYHLDRELLK